MDLCVICLVNVPDAQMRPYGYSMICRECTRELMTRSQPCPICRKPISSFEVGVYCESLGARGLWPTSYKNLRQLASEEGFNEYFRKQFNENEEPYLRWKEVFDVFGGGFWRFWSWRCRLGGKESTRKEEEEVERSEEAGDFGRLCGFGEGVWFCWGL